MCKGVKEFVYIYIYEIETWEITHILEEEGPIDFETANYLAIIESRSNYYSGDEYKSE